MDLLSDVLGMIRLRGALFLNTEFHEPWRVDAPSGQDLEPMLVPGGAWHLAICRLVVESRCWVQLHGGEPLPLAAGDVVTLPHGDPHLVGSGPGHAPIRIDDAVRLKLPELARVRYGGDGDRTIIVCGWFAYEGDLPNPLIATLPLLFSSPVGQRACGPWIEQSIRYALGKAPALHPGSDVIAARVAQVLFLEALRRYIKALPLAQIGWLAGVRDPLVGRCLALLHDQPARAWTVPDLARGVHISRSVLAERFNELVGMPPMHYLKRWRLAIAARRLRSERDSLGRIAGSAGYESGSAFNRAFKREYGVAPGLWRRAGDSSTDAHDPVRVQPAASAP